MKRAVLSLLSAALFLSSSASGKMLSADDYKIGVYYFPGWRDLTLHSPSPRPWAAIKPYPERKPLLGWYYEGQQEVADKQLAWMKSYGLDYVVYDWYFGDYKKIYLEHALNAFLRSANRHGLQFSILLANNDSRINSLSDWQKVVQYWITNYFSRPEYLQMQGKPVVFIADAGTFSQQAKKYGMTAQTLLQLAQQMAHKGGLPGIYFVGGTGAYIPMITTVAKADGYAALSAYNYHGAPDDKVFSHNYKQLDNGYQQHWQRFMAKSSLPYIVPMSSGWDKRPWGGSGDPLHDHSLSTPEEFRQHLLAAKAVMDSYPDKTNKMGVICCWNEFGEGSFIEPTVAYGFSYLKQVADVLGKQK